MEKKELLRYILNLKTIVKAEKSARVYAIPASEEDRVATYTKDGNLETINVAEKGDYILTKLDNKTGVVDLSNNGRPNQWIVKPDKFAKKYVKDNSIDNPYVYKPIGGVQTFVQIDKDIEIVAPWGELQYIKSGGYLNVTDVDDVYGIAEVEFNETYNIIK